MKRLLLWLLLLTMTVATGCGPVATNPARKPQVLYGWERIDVPEAGLSFEFPTDGRLIPRPSTSRTTDYWSEGKGVGVTINPEVTLAQTVTSDNIEEYFEKMKRDDVNYFHPSFLEYEMTITNIDSLTNYLTLNRHKNGVPRAVQRWIFRGNKQVQFDVNFLPVSAEEPEELQERLADVQRIVDSLALTKPESATAK